MDKYKLTIEFLYFAYNYASRDLVELFASMNNPAHFESEFLKEKKMPKHSTGTQAFLSWFMGLSTTNKQHVLAWVEKNYSSGMS